MGLQEGNDFDNGVSVYGIAHDISGTLPAGFLYSDT